MSPIHGSGQACSPAAETKSAHPTIYLRTPSTTRPSTNRACRIRVGRGGPGSGGPEGPLGRWWQQVTRVGQGWCRLRHLFSGLDGLLDGQAMRPPRAYPAIVPGRLDMVLKSPLHISNLLHKIRGPTLSYRGRGMGPGGCASRSGRCTRPGPRQLKQAVHLRVGQGKPPPLYRDSLKPHHLEKSNAVAHCFRTGELMVAPEGVTGPNGQVGAGEDGWKGGRSPSTPPPRPVRRMEGDDKPKGGVAIQFPGGGSI